MKKTNEKIVSKINPKYFNQDLVNSAYDFYMSDKEKTKEERTKLSDKIKAEYNRIDEELKESIKREIDEVNNKTNSELTEIISVKENGLKAEDEKYSKLINPSKEESVNILMLLRVLRL